MASIYTTIVREKLRNIAELTNKMIVDYNEVKKTELHHEITDIWRYMNSITNIEAKCIKDLIIKMTIAFDAFMAGAINREQLVTYMVKNEAVSALINHLECIS
ncbi:MAG: hypothetical protein ACTSQY_10690 [Candidatus Odinarchaeia archaeon]